jgi:hypothetical protein
VVARYHAGDARADFLYDASTLVTENDRNRKGDGAVEDRHVAVAQTSPHDPDLDLPLSGRSGLEVIAHLQFTRPDDSSHFQASMGIREQYLAAAGDVDTTVIYDTFRLRT